MNEFIEGNMGLYFAVGVASTILVFFTLIIGTIKLLILLFTPSKKGNAIFNLLANICLLISLALVAWLFFKLLTAGTGSASGLMIPLFAPVPAFFCILYIIFSIKAAKQLENS